MVSGMVGGNGLLVSNFGGVLVQNLAGSVMLDPRTPAVICDNSRSFKSNFARHRIVSRTRNAAIRAHAVHQIPYFSAHDWILFIDIVGP